MLRRRIFLVITIMVLLVLNIAGCNIPKPTKGIISGRVLIPPTAKELSRDISGWVPAAGAEVTIVDANGVKHTVITDANGYYTFENIAVNANTVVTAKVTVDGKTMVLKTVIEKGVGKDQTHNTGTMTPESTALALVVEQLVKAGEPVNLDEIKATEAYTKLVDKVNEVLEEQGNVESDSGVAEAVDEASEEIINPPTPPTPTPPDGGGGGSTTVQLNAVTAEGIPVIGQNLTAKVNPDKATVTYKWLRADAELGTYEAIRGATEKIYTLTDGDIDKWIKVEITGTGNYTGIKTSEAIGPVSHVFNSTIKKGYEAIQDAINEANEGDTILVGPGEYEELVKIGKSVTLKGANAGINPNNGARGPESTITGENSTEPQGYHRGAGIQLLNNVQNVIIDGFEFKETTGARSWFQGNDQGAIHLAPTDNGYASGSKYNDFKNITIMNNYFHDLSAHAIFKDVFASYDGLLILNNLMENIGGSGEDFTAIKIQGFAGQRASEGIYAGVNGGIKGNTIDNVAYAGIILDNVDDFLIDGNTIKNIPSTGINVDAQGLGNRSLTISNNTIDNVAGTEAKAAVRVKNGPYKGDIKINNNVIKDSNAGLLFESGISPEGNDTFIIEKNKLSGNTIGMNNKSDKTLTATHNWWGDESGPQHESNPDGLGDSVSDNIIYSPWCTNEGCTAHSDK